MDYLLGGSGSANDRTSCDFGTVFGSLASAHVHGVIHESGGVAWLILGELRHFR